MVQGDGCGEVGQDRTKGGGDGEEVRHMRSTRRQGQWM